MNKRDECKLTDCNNKATAHAWITTCGVKHPEAVCHDCARRLLACGARVEWFVVKHTEHIVCPSCSSTEAATVTKTYGVPFAVYVHECGVCCFMIGESEWFVVEGGN